MPVTKSAILGLHGGSSNGVEHKLPRSNCTCAAKFAPRHSQPATQRSQGRTKLAENILHSVLYWGGSRYYRYTVEASKDGKTWRQIVDMSQNTEPATPHGHDHRFDSVETRHVRMNVLYHSLNRGVHLVEVKLFEAR